MTIYYESMCNHTASQQECADLADAVGCAWADMETGEAWPARILSADRVLWEQGGPLHTRISLLAFAETSGVFLVAQQKTAT
jgi:hypothetical protein